MNLGDQLKAAIDKVITSGEIEQAISDAVTKTVKDAIASQLRPYSEFGKSVEESVKSAFQFHPIDLPSYNNLIVNLVRHAVKDQADKSIAAQVEKQVIDLFEPAPKELLLSKLVEQYVDRIRGKNDDGCVCYGDASAKIKLGDGTVDPFIHIDFFESTSDRQEEIHLGVYLDREEASEGGHQQGHIYYIRFRDANIENKMFVDPLRGLERMLFQMKAEKSKLIIDCDPSDLDLDTAPSR